MSTVLIPGVGVVDASSTVAVAGAGLLQVAAAGGTTHNVDATEAAAAASIDASAAVFVSSATEAAASASIDSAVADFIASLTDAAASASIDAAVADFLADIAESAAAADLADWIASGAPTLSAATVINITGTQATPRVTLTF